MGILKDLLGPEVIYMDRPKKEGRPERKAQSAARHKHPHRTCCASTGSPSTIKWPMGPKKGHMHAPCRSNWPTD